MKRRGVAMRLVIGGGISSRKTDQTLLKAVARGHKWFNELVTGRAAFTREIAARERVNERFVRRLIPLAFLSPAIVQAIAEGRQPADLTAAPSIFPLTGASREQRLASSPPRRVGEPIW
jgi:site-specific DNA recombinase